MGRHVQAVTAVVLVVVGLYTLTGRLVLDPVAMAREVHSPMEVRTNAHSVPPCCEKHDRAN
jgi:hypothetical protein